MYLCVDMCSGTVHAAPIMSALLNEARTSMGASFCRRGGGGEGKGRGGEIPGYQFWSRNTPLYTVLFGRTAPLFCCLQSEGGAGKTTRGVPTLSLSRSLPGILSRTPPASYSYLLDFSSKMYPVSTPELSVYTCLHAAQLNTPPRSMRSSALERY